MSPNQTTTTRYDITDGPSAERIWDHAKYARTSPDVRIPVYFTTGQRTAGPVKTSALVMLRPIITGVEHEDGSGNKLNIVGYVNHTRFMGWYDARRRTGFIEVGGS